MAFVRGDYSVCVCVWYVCILISGCFPSFPWFPSYSSSTRLQHQLHYPLLFSRLTDPHPSVTHWLVLASKRGERVMRRMVSPEMHDMRRGPGRCTTGAKHRARCDTDPRTYHKTLTNATTVAHGQIEDKEEVP
jgi:hypothetical protein